MIKVQKILQKKKSALTRKAPAKRIMAKNRSVILRANNHNQSSSIPSIEEAVEAASDTADFGYTLPANFST